MNHHQRHFFLFCLLLFVASLDSLAAEISGRLSAGYFTATNGLISVTVDLHTGSCDYSMQNCPTQIAAAAAIKFDGSATSSLTTDYSAHITDQPAGSELNTPLGPARQFTVRHLRPGSPALEQVFTLYADKPWMLLQLRALSDHQLRSNWIAPLICPQHAPAMTQLSAVTKVIEMPFDNDNWRWDIAHSLNGSAITFTSHEVTAIYNNDLAIIAGSITHDFWKSAVDIRLGKQPGTLNRFCVYGGASTDDVSPHGEMVGKQIASPTILLGFFRDLPKGLHEFGRANAAITPPLSWNRGVPFGWMTFGAIGGHYHLPQILAVSDFLHQHLQNVGFHDRNGSLCIILDGNSAALAPEDLQAAIEHIHANSQQAGCYLSPFTYWRNRDDDLTRKFAGTRFTRAQVILRDQLGRPIQHKQNSYVLDVTHPAVREVIARQIDQAKRLDFDYFKLDFLTDGSLEGRHADPQIRSGIQAYNQAMRFIVNRVGPEKFISLSIAPMFPSGYGQSRRISCDIYSQLNDHTPGYRPFGSTQYLLNCVTYGWWMARTIYPFNDPDEMSIYRFHDAPPVPEAWARSRITASIASGGNFIDADDFSTLPSAHRAETMLTNPFINEVAREGIPMLPVFDNQMDRDTATTFYRREGAQTLAALFNFDAAHSAEHVIDFKALQLPENNDYVLRDLWTDRIVAQTKIRAIVHLLPGDAMLLQICAR